MRRSRKGRRSNATGRHIGRLERRHAVERSVIGVHGPRARGVRLGKASPPSGYLAPANLKLLIGVKAAASWPVRRILSGRLLARGGHPSRPAVARRLQRSTRGSGRAVLPLFDLAPDGVYRAIRVAPDAGALLPHRFTLTCAADIPLQVGPVAIGGLLSVALSCGSPRLGVTQHPALRSPDVPRTDHHSEERVRTRPPGRLATTHHSITGNHGAISAMCARGDVAIA